MEHHSSRFLPDIFTLCCWKVTAMLLLVEGTQAGSAISLVCMPDCSTLKFPQASFIQCCSEVMVLLWLGEATFAGSAVYHSWAKECLTLRFLQDLVIRCSFEVMALLLLLDKMMKDNAIFHFWRMECHTLMFLPVDCIHYFSEVMARLLFVEGTMKDSAIFHRWKPEVATLAAGSYFWNLVLCNWNLFMMVIAWHWYARIWQEMRQYVCLQGGLTWPWMHANSLRMNWMSIFKILNWFCPMDSYWLQFALHIRTQQLQMWVNMAIKLYLIESGWMIFCQRQCIGTN